MDSILLAFVAYGLLIIIACAIGFYGLVHGIAAIGDKSTRIRLTSSYRLSVVLSVITLLLLISTLAAGRGFFNFPHDVNGREVTTTWPYNVERVALAVMVIASLYSWVRYVRDTKPSKNRSTHN